MSTLPTRRNDEGFDHIALQGSSNDHAWINQQKSQITWSTWDSEVTGNTSNGRNGIPNSNASNQQQRTRVYDARIQILGFDFPRIQVILFVAFVGWILTFGSGLLVGGKFLNLSKKSKETFWVTKNVSDYPDILPPSNITVGVFYYPWSYTGKGTLREQLGEEPTLGYYDASDQQTVTQHLAWSRLANIRMWAVSWKGPDSEEDITVKNSIFAYPMLGKHKIALLYETLGRIQQEFNYSTNQVASDIEYICQSYFDHPNYFTINGRPVLFVYLTRKLQALGLMTTVIDLMRGANCGNHTLYIVGDQVFGQAPESKNLTAYQPFELLDAVTNYDVYGSMGIYGYAGEQDVINYYQHDELGWRQQALAAQCGFVPSVAAGYNDLGVRPEAHHAPLSRRLTSNSSPEGSLFQVSLEQARLLVDPAMNNLLMVTSFNEWHEDTQIEPCVGKATSLPDTLTHGLEYEGYGELYLDILRETTSIEGESAGI